MKSFEYYWKQEGARVYADTHEDRARHAFEAGMEVGEGLGYEAGYLDGYLDGELDGAALGYEDAMEDHRIK